MNKEQSTTIQHRIRVKFCGITRENDALYAAQLGVDAIGFVFYEKSPRSVSIQQAKRIAQALPPFITRVGLFVNAETALVQEAIEETGLDLLQFHGDETVAECERFQHDYIKAVRMKQDIELPAMFTKYQTAKGLLLDAYDKNMFGGTGKSFDWSMVSGQRPLPIILAGGLKPENVGQAINEVHPYAVDVSGGIEVGKGIKDKEKMNAFMKGVFTNRGKNSVRSE